MAGNIAAKLKNTLSERKGVAAGALAIAVAAVGILIRRERRVTLELPDPGVRAAETAISVHNAAKATVISAVREADQPDTVLLQNTVRDAMREGVWAGADLTAVAAGVVEGAMEVSHLMNEDAEAAGSTAALAAMEVADAQGRVAAARIRDMLEPHGLVT
ncbi:MAG: hypothetical protein ACLFWH_12145 [Actinomycetota bacterium]